jgi:hypothetical protein
MLILQHTPILIYAALTVPFVLGILVPLITWSRERRFKIRETDRRHTDRKAIAAEWGVPDVAASDVSISVRSDQLGRHLNVLHEEANGLQSCYHRQVARCVCCLGLALLMLGLSLTVFRNHKEFERYASAVELVAFGVALWQWCAARVANHRWVAARTKVELLRQWTFLSAMFERAAAVEPDSAKRDFEAKAVEIDARVVTGPPRGCWQWLRAVAQVRNERGDTIESRLWKYWHNARAYYLANSTGSVLGLSDFHFYMRRRPIRQLAWFRVAQLRVQRAASHRDATMAGLFAVSIALAAFKLILVGHGAADNVEPVSTPSGDWAIDAVSLGLLLATALSAALTTLYLSRNDRSLLHRYAAQERRIEDWLYGVLNKSEGPDGGRVAPASSALGESDGRKFHREPDPMRISAHASEMTQAPANHRLHEQVLEFEALMIDELIDWIHISTHDALELAA